jgi:hypothetical protein
MAYADKLYVPIAKYDSDQNGVISDAELAAAVGLLVNKSVSGANVPTGTTIQGVSRAVSVPSNAAEADAQSLSKMLELVLTQTVAFSGDEKNGSVTGTDSVAGKFRTGTITIGETSADYPEGTIAISNIRPDGVKRGATSAVDLKIEIQAAGSLELKDNDFSIMTHVDLRSKQAALLEDNMFASDTELNVWAHEDITFKGVSVYSEPRMGGAPNPKVWVESNSKSVYVNTSRGAVAAMNASVGPHDGPAKVAARTVMKATAVRFTADNGDIVINGATFQGGFSNGGNNASEFSARAKNTIGIYDTAIDHSKVSIAANTVVLKDVEFSAGSAVTLGSRLGMVSANPGIRTSVVQGNVNILSGVKYGSHDIRFNSNTHMDQAAFRSAWVNGNNVSQSTADKISIVKN